MSIIWINVYQKFFLQKLKWKSSLQLLKKNKVPAPTEPEEPLPGPSTPSHEGESESDEELPTPTRKKKNYNDTRRFNEDWKKFLWLEKTEENNSSQKPFSRPFCKACKKTIYGGITHIKRHENTFLHQHNVQKVKNTPKIDTFVNSNAETTNLIKSGELKLTMFLHEHNLPFSLMDHLPDLLRSICPDSKIAKQIQCARTKATVITKECIAKHQVCELVKSLQENVFSLIVDETTDIGTEKSLALVVRFFNKNDWKDHFLGLIKVKSCSAEDLFKTICNYFQELDIPLNNLIGFAADNAAVMMGNLNGLQAKFKEILPNIFILGCVCHSFHLCSSAAAKKLPRSLEDFVRALYNYFAPSSKRTEKLVEFQTFVRLKPHKLLHPSQTRWLSLQAAVARILENWEALILFFTEECFEHNLHSIQQLLDSLKNPVFKIYCSFLVYILEIVNKLNLEFQSESPKLHLLLKRVEDLYRTILRSFVKKSYLDKTPIENVDPENPRHFVDLEQLYLGVGVELLLSKHNIDQTELHNFRLRVLDFFVELCKQIKLRFNFQNPVLLFVSNFDPKRALGGDINSIAVMGHKLFPELVTDLESLNTEWRLLSDLHDFKKYEDLPVQQFWIKIFNTKSELDIPMFPNLTNLIKGIFSLPHSSASAERVFSQLNLLKTKTRNRLEVSTCDSILHAKQHLGSQTCSTWVPSSSLLKRKAV